MPQLVFWEMVTLLTHNFLTSNVRGVKVSYPLRIVVQEVEHEDNEYDPALDTTITAGTDLMLTSVRQATLEFWDTDYAHGPGNWETQFKLGIMICFGGQSTQSPSRDPSRDNGGHRSDRIQ